MWIVLSNITFHSQEYSKIVKPMSEKKNKSVFTVSFRGNTVKDQHALKVPNEISFH